MRSALRAEDRFRFGGANITGVLHLGSEYLDQSYVNTDQRQTISGRLNTIGAGVLRTTIQRNARTFDGLISICGK